MDSQSVGKIGKLSGSRGREQSGFRCLKFGEKLVELSHDEVD